MKIYFIAALGVCTILLTLPAHAGESARDTMLTKLNSSHATQAETSFTKPTNPAQIDNDPEQQGVDCFYAENDDEPFCKEQKKAAEKSTGVLLQNNTTSGRSPINPSNDNYLNSDSLK